MKNIFAKKTTKILTGVVLFFLIFSVFDLSFALNGETVGTISYYGERSENYPCQESVNKICVMKTRYYRNLNGDEVEQVIQKPNDGISGGKVSEYYTDNKGQSWYRTGVSNSKDETISLNNWNEGKKTELQNNNSSESFTFTLLQPLPTESGEFLSKNVTLKQYLTWAYKFVLALTGFLAVMMIVIGGVEYVISGANESMRGEAHKRIWGAITGLILALVAYLVLYTINPSLVNFEDNWFFKPRNMQTQNQNQTQSNKTMQTNNNINQGVQKMNDLKFDEKVMQDSNMSNTGSSNSKDETKIKETGISNVEIKKTIKPYE